ncbi:hypothetical protein OEZ86_009887 [Tetradesmus obliquus]|uniref:Voltage-dependent anion-selective channel protein 3 n=1 Tax=Tetradesmus obliquus TaxID=3088 RepID=A0ABY8UNQ2_TETOB|nr:hypothetical protein OEZ85_001324 [Tetradesmus obliquus]WIA43408.1 hypothetical protein OEZ86_009887 [Tetradesmus obliquus]
MAVAISDIGKEVRSILYGAKDGVFQYDQKLSYSTRTADGVQLVLNAIRKDEKADLSLRTVYNYGNYGLNATFTTSDKVHVLASVDKIAPGVKVSLSATLPDKESGKLLVDYINQHVHLKTSVGMTTQPKVTLSAASGYKNLVFGGEVAYSTEKSAVSNYGLALGLHAGDSQLAVHLQDKLETLKFMAAHNVSKDKMLAAEITRPVAGGDVTFHLGIARRMENGALLKTKVDHKGTLSALYEQRLATGERFVLSTQLDTLNIGGKAPKVGFALDLA